MCDPKVNTSFSFPHRQGEPGASGPIGPPGPQGEPGLPGYDGVQGNVQKLLKKPGIIRVH